MGKFVYEGGPKIEIEDRALTHLQLVMTAKLRRSEPFSFTWKEDQSIGHGRTTVWLHASCNIVFKYAGSRQPAINRLWIEALAYTASSPSGLYLVPEPQNVNSVQDMELEAESAPVDGAVRGVRSSRGRTSSSIRRIWLMEVSTRFIGAVEAGLVLADTSGKLHVIGSTSERASDVEDAEVGSGEGPCLDSRRTGQSVETPDIQNCGDRWPVFVPVATKRGFRSGYAVPLLLRGQRLGALNLFFDRVDAVTDRDAAIAQALADFETIGIIHHRALQEHVGRAARLQHALDSRVVIEQAKAALAHQRSVSIDEAFRIRGHTRSMGVRLHDVAEQIVTRQLSL
jgi:hypothetical protein